MKQSKLFQLFNSLSDQELRDLKQFVGSPFHNQREDVIRLFDTLRKAKTQKQFSEQKVFASVYPKQVFNKKELAYVMSYLMKVIEEFLIYQEMKQDRIQEQLYLAKAYRGKKQWKRFYRSIDKAQDLIEKSPFDNLSTYYYHHQIAMERYDLQKNQVRVSPLNLQQMVDHFDVFLIGSKLQQACILLTHQNIFQTEYEQGLLEKILVHISSADQTTLRSKPCISLYYHCLQTMAGEEQEVHFHQLVKLLDEQHHFFTLEELKDFYQTALNYGIKRLNEGHVDYIRATFELYKKGLEKEVFFENGILSQFTFKNIVALGLGLKEYEWVEQFIYNYQSYLDPHERENNFHYNLAKLQYERGQFKEAMLLLQQVKYEDILPNLTAKNLLLKIYYELNEPEVLSHYLKSFESQVRRQRGIGYHKEHYLNLILTMRRFLNINPYDRQAIEQFREEVMKMEKLPEKKWLLMQLENV